MTAEALAPIEAPRDDEESTARPATDEATPGADAGEREGGRRRRGRDRFRREPREEGQPLEAGEAALQTPVEAAPQEAAEAPPMAVATPATSLPPGPERSTVGFTQYTAAPMPRVEAFSLPTDELQSLAAAAGLEWVNSDAEKIRLAQDAMAAEPKPIHVPREIKPVVLVDEGPLVLVETRKDLSQLKLPFDQTAS